MCVSAIYSAGAWNGCTECARGGAIGREGRGDARVRGRNGAARRGTGGRWWNGGVTACSNCVADRGGYKVCTYHNAHSAAVKILRATRAHTHVPLPTSRCPHPTFQALPHPPQAPTHPAPARRARESCPAPERGPWLSRGRRSDPCARRAAGSSRRDRRRKEGRGEARRWRWRICPRVVLIWAQRMQRPRIRT